MAKVERSDAELHKVFAHPLRVRMLRAMEGRVMSPNMLKDELGAPLGVVSYHMRILRDRRAVKLVRTEPRRGALEHFYRATLQVPGDDWHAAQGAPGAPRKRVTDPLELQEAIAELLGCDERDVNVGFAQEIGSTVYTVDVRVITEVTSS